MATTSLGTSSASPSVARIVGVSTSAPKRSAWTLDSHTAVTSPLSPRELEVAALLARGHTNKQVAAQLHISERTAQNHVQHILTKLGLANRTQVATWFTSR
jgi:DNA-binding NarL/FixJ family response regulator